MATPLSAIAEGNNGLLTTSGIKAENTASAWPCQCRWQTSAPASGALITSKAKAAHSSNATTATQNCVKMK